MVTDSNFPKLLYIDLLGMTKMVNVYRLAMGHGVISFDDFKLTLEDTRVINQYPL